MNQIDFYKLSCQIFEQGRNPDLILGRFEQGRDLDLILNGFDQGRDPDFFLRVRPGSLP